MRFSAKNEHDAHVNFSYKTAADWLDCAIKQDFGLAVS